LWPRRAALSTPIRPRHLEVGSPKGESYRTPAVLGRRGARSSQDVARRADTNLPESRRTNKGCLTSETCDIRSAGEAVQGCGRWSNKSHPRPACRHAPSAGTARVTSEPTEDVRFVRDEQANMVWAIEYLTQGGDGRPWPGRQRHVASTQNEPKEVVPVTTAPLYYRLQSFVPWHWFPMLPVKINQITGDTVLERGQMVRPDGVTSPVPFGRILQTAALPYRVREEAVSRTGLKVMREMVRSRWLSGETHLWIARRKTAGRGEGSSGLRYDEARTSPPPAP